MRSIILTLLLSSMCFAVDTSNIYQLASYRVYAPDNKMGHYNVALCVYSGKTSSYFLISQYNLGDEMLLGRPKEPQLVSNLYTKSEKNIVMEEYNLALIQTPSIKTEPCKFNDPKPNEPIDIVVQVFTPLPAEGFDFVTVENCKLHNIKTRKGLHAEDISQVEVEYLAKELPFGGGVMYNKAGEVIGLLVHCRNKDNKVIVSGPSGLTIQNYLKSIKYDFPAPEAPKE